MPKPATDDPLQDPYWTIPMALAWIHEPGKLDAVRKLSGHRVELWQLPRERQSQQESDHGVIQTDQFVIHINGGVLEVGTLAGWDVLKKKLKGGVFEAWGPPFDQDKRVSIPAHEWRDLDLIQEGHRFVVRFDGAPRSGYSDVVFRSSDICAAWPADKKASTIAAETRCKGWLIELMKSGSRDQPKKHYLALARQKCAVTDRGFLRRIWPAAIAESGNTHWNKPGRPRSKS